MTTAPPTAGSLPRGGFEPHARRTAVGMAVLLAAAAIAAWAWPALRTAAGAFPLVEAGLIGSLAAGLATGAGALPVLFASRVSQRAQDAMLGFAAGVMLAATAFSLVLPGISAGEALLGSRALGSLLVGVGILTGGVFLKWADRAIPREHFVKGREGGDADAWRRIWLFVLAITLHNFPEGLAVGVGFGSGDPGALALAVGIGLQNMPEGLAVAVALLGLGYGRWRALAIATATGLAEPLAGLVGAGLVTASRTLMPLAMGGAAGAMLFVISHEIIPETHRQGHEAAATFGLLVGFVAMTLLDTTLS